MQFRIGKKEISKKSPAFIIAELSANHNHDFDIAVKTLEAIKDVGADAVKLQTYTPDTITLKCRNDYFKIKGNNLWKDRYLYDLYKDAYTPWEWHAKLKETAESLGLVFFSSPFDFSAVDFLEELEVPAYKIASFEITDIPLIRYIASKNKPVIISTGIASPEDIDLAVNTCREVGNHEIALLKCTSSYPTPVEQVNLNAIKFLEEKFSVIVGLSDHTMTNTVPIGAVTLGARIIEKHFILDRNMGGPDSAFSLEPQEFKSMIDSVREVESALGSETYTVTTKMKEGRAFSRSLFATRDIAKGESFDNTNVRSVRPGYGLHPKYFEELNGKKATRNIPFGHPIEKEDLG